MPFRSAITWPLTVPKHGVADGVAVRGVGTVCVTPDSDVSVMMELSVAVTPAAGVVVSTPVALGLAVADRVALGAIWVRATASSEVGVGVGELGAVALGATVSVG